MKPTAEDVAAAEIMRKWLEEQDGIIKPLSVAAVHDENFSGEPSWFFTIVLPVPDSPTGTWDSSALLDLKIAFRDKALEVGLTYPWYVQPKPEFDDVPHEDDLEDGVNSLEEFSF